MIGIEIFAGSGGMALGAKNAGVDVKIAVENDHYAAQTYLKNHKGTTVVPDDIENIKEFNFQRDRPVVLFGGPPCQGFSKANRKTRSTQNPNNWLFQEFFRVARIVKPDWIVLENVPGLKSMDEGFFLDEIFNNLKSLGFTPNAKILNAADYGVPQNRERLFIVGSKNGIVFDFPIGKYKDRPVTVYDALHDLPALENGANIEKLPYKSKPLSSFAKRMRKAKRLSRQNHLTRNADFVLERYRHIPEGGNWQNIPLELMSNYQDASRCHSGIYRRLDRNKPSVVITNYRKSMLIHPTENRGLSVREAARLQSFPDDYLFVGSLDQKQQQVGNAVPPMLAESVFKTIIDYSS